MCCMRYHIFLTFASRLSHVETCYPMLQHEVTCLFYVFTCGNIWEHGKSIWYFCKGGVKEMEGNQEISASKIQESNVNGLLQKIINLLIWKKCGQRQQVQLLQGFLTSSPYELLKTPGQTQTYGNTHCYDPGIGAPGSHTIKCPCSSHSQEGQPTSKSQVQVAVFILELQSGAMPK